MKEHTMIERLVINLYKTDAIIEHYSNNVAPLLGKTPEEIKKEVQTISLNLHEAAKTKITSKGE